MYRRRVAEHVVEQGGASFVMVKREEGVYLFDWWEFSRVGGERVRSTKGWEAREH
jgi:hypothetical protein